MTHTNIKKVKTVPDCSIIWLAYLTVCLSFSSCENDLEKIKIITFRENYPTESARDAEVMYSDSAHVRARLITPRLDHYSGERPYVELPEGLNLVFYNENLKITSRLTANYAISYEDIGKMEARGDVVLINEIGEKLNTERLTWDEKSRKIYSDEFVKITTPGEILMGEGFESNQEFTNFKIKHIKGTILVDN